VEFYYTRLAVHLALAGGIGGLAAIPAAQASGFAIPELSIAGLGTSNALVANPVELGAIAYNPAAMGFHDLSFVSAGLMFCNPDLEVTTSTGSHSSTGSSTVLIPTFQGAMKVDDRWRIGLGVTAPFGLETEWPIGTFPQLSGPIGPLPPGVFHPSSSSLELADVNPTVAFKVNDQFSLAAGIDYYHAKKVVLDTYLVKIRGDGDGWGWNLGAMYSDGPLSIGANFHSKATLDVEGDFTQLGSPGIGAQADLNLPWRFQLGVRYAFTGQLAAEFDWSRTGWSNFEEILVTSSATGAELSRSENHWDDSNAYRLGLTYDLNPDTQLRFGYTYDETGQPAEYYTPRIPDADRQTFSIGAAHHLGDGWELEGGYMYVTWDENNYQGTRPFNPLASSDINGTTAVAGDYKAHAHIVGLGMNKSF